MSTEPLIVAVIHRYHPSWVVPGNTGREWEPTLCPWHGDSNQSASVSFKRNAFNCFTCDQKGDAIAIIMREELVPYQSAVRLATELSGGSYQPVPIQSARKQSRRTFDSTGTEQRADPKPVRARVRRRTFTGS